MSNKYYLIIIIGMAIVTYIPRVLPILFLSKKDFPKWVIEFLEFLPISLFTALIVKEIFSPETIIDLSIKKILPIIVVGLSIYKTKSIGLSIIFGTIIFAILSI